MRPLLSICIPTYNRSQYLKQALETYVSNAAFDDEVEIVISDNASTDNTEKIGRDYASRYSNVKYFRNEENVHDSNFCLALDRGTGIYLKLMNDNLIITEDGLSFLKKNILKYIEKKPAIFFVGNNIFNYAGQGDCHLERFEDYVVHLSYYTTAIHCFGAWKDDWANVKDRTKYSKLKLNQDDWAYQIMENRGEGYLCKGQYQYSIKLESQYRSGYNWFEVHVENYYAILKPYIEKGLVSSKALSLERRTYLKALRPQIAMSYLYDPNGEWQFDMSGTTKILWNNYRSESLFYFYIIFFPIWGVYWLLISYLRKIRNKLRKVRLREYRSK